MSQDVAISPGQGSVHLSIGINGAGPGDAGQADTRAVPGSTGSTPSSSAGGGNSPSIGSTHSSSAGSSSAGFTSSSAPSVSSGVEGSAASGPPDTALGPQVGTITVQTNQAVVPYPILVLPGLPLAPNPPPSNAVAAPPPATTPWVAMGPVPQINAWAVAQQAEKDVPLPAISLKVNPDPGVVAVPSWFWIDGYQGQPITGSKTVHASHTECRVAAGAAQCRSVDDSVTVNLRLEPAQYAWTYGDGEAGSQQVFTDNRGLGHAYTDAKTPSPVSWSYAFSSFGLSTGFPLSLSLTWSAAFQVNGGAWQALAPVRQTYARTFQVQQVQPLRVPPPSGQESP